MKMMKGKGKVGSVAPQLDLEKEGPQSVPCFLFAGEKTEGPRRLESRYPFKSSTSSPRAETPSVGLVRVRVLPQVTLYILVLARTSVAFKALP